MFILGFKTGIKLHEESGDESGDGVKDLGGGFRGKGTTIQLIFKKKICTDRRFKKKKTM